MIYSQLLSGIFLKDTILNLLQLSQKFSTHSFVLFVLGSIDDVLGDLLGDDGKVEDI